MAEETKSKSGKKERPYTPYGLFYGTPHGFRFVPAYRWPYVPRPLPPFGVPFGVAGYSPFGVPFSAETARKQELEMLKVQAQYFEEILNDIKKGITELESEAEKKK
jgi:hypothetical protein